MEVELGWLLLSAKSSFYFLYGRLSPKIELTLMVPYNVLSKLRHF